VTVVIVDGEIAGRGRGTTKKAAQQEAAAMALERMAPDAPAPEFEDGQSVFLSDLLLAQVVQPRGLNDKETESIEAAD
jgi:hypothetical protein